jgi:hypothetical protein
MKKILLIIFIKLNFNKIKMIFKNKVLFEKILKFNIDREIKQILLDLLKLIEEKSETQNSNVGDLMNNLSNTNKSNSSEKNQTISDIMISLAKDK